MLADGDRSQRILAAHLRMQGAGGVGEHGTARGVEADAVNVGALDGVGAGLGHQAVLGAGVAYDGLYYVKRVTSTLKRGEFKQSFQLTRNGLVSTVPGVRP